MVAQKKAHKSKAKSATPTALPVIRPRVAGIDIGSSQHWVCGPASADGEPNVRVFGTTTDELNALADWLVDQHVESVAMESTAVYWIPLYELLESRGVEVVLLNARQLHHVPGRKTDVNDATWIADLLAHGLIRSSFVPPARIQALRDLTRTRKQFVREIAQHTLRIQKVLEDANIKLGSVLTNILGKSGRAMLAAIIAGEEDPERLAALAVGTARRKHPALVEALRGRATGHHRALLQLHLDLIAALETALAKVDAAVGEALAPIHALSLIHI